MGRVATLGVMLLLATVARAETWSVQRDGSGDFVTIQPALDAAAAGDTILIGPGEYTEAVAIRPPGWASDIQSYADVRCDDLTIVGAGANITSIGPPTYEANAEGDPAGLSYGGGRSLTISDLGIRNSYAMYVVGTVFMDRCHFTNNKRGLVWEPRGPGGWVRDSVFETTQYIFDAQSFNVGNGGQGTGIMFDQCRFLHYGVVHSGTGIEIVDCEMRGVALYGTTHAILRRCRVTDIDTAVSQSGGGGGVCEIYDSDLSGTFCAIRTSDFAPGSRFVITNSKLTGGSQAVFWPAHNAGPYEVHGCDFMKGTGPVVLCVPNGPIVTHDLRNNYWGLADEATIRSWIIDRSDNPQIGATVLYSPYAGQSVPTESTSWGDLKALWR